MSDTRPIALCIDCRRPTRVPRFEVEMSARIGSIPSRITYCIRCCRQTVKATKVNGLYFLRKARTA